MERPGVTLFSRGSLGTSTHDVVKHRAPKGHALRGTPYHRSRDPAKTKTSSWPFRQLSLWREGSGCLKVVLRPGITRK